MEVNAPTVLAIFVLFLAIFVLVISVVFLYSSR